MIVAGFDPGISGAACAISVSDMGTELVEIIDLPTCPDGTKRQLDIAPLAAWIEKMAPDLAIIENVQPMMGNGSDSQAMMGANSFRFGMVCGALRGLLGAYLVPWRLVTAKSWKTHYGLRGSDKEASRQMALRMCPAAAPFLKRKLDHNRADALLIALYGAAKSSPSGLSDLRPKK